MEAEEKIGKAEAALDMAWLISSVVESSTAVDDSLMEGLSIVGRCF